jgi:hypothetical protein
MKTAFVLLCMLLLVNCTEDEINPNCQISATIGGVNSACYDFHLILENGNIWNHIREDLALSFDIEEGTEVIFSAEEVEGFQPDCLAIFPPGQVWVRILCIEAK